MCRGPGTHWIAANGGTLTSTVRPGTRSSSRPRLYRTAARKAGRSGCDPAASTSVTAASAAAPSTRSVASPGHGGSPSAARCSFRAASSLPRSGLRCGTAKQASGCDRQRRRHEAPHYPAYRTARRTGQRSGPHAAGPRPKILPDFRAIWPHQCPDPGIRSVCPVSAVRQAHEPGVPGCPGSLAWVPWCSSRGPG